MSVVAAPVRTVRAAGGGASHAINYVTREGKYTGEHEPAAAVFTWGVTSRELAAEEMEMLAARSRREEPLAHLVLSWRTGEHPTADQAKEAAEIAMRHLGLEGCQAGAALHRDTDNDHLHLVVNTVGRTGPARSLWQSDNKLYAATREIEREQGWELSPERDLVGRTRYNERPAKNYETWAGRPSLERDQAVAAVREALERPDASWRDIHDALRANDLRYVKSPYGGRVERQDEPGTGAGAKATLGLSHRELENRLGKYHPDFIGERSFESRARSATLAVLSERAAEGRSWERVHELMTDHGLDYARHGGGARLVDRQSGDTMKSRGRRPALAPWRNGKELRPDDRRRDGRARSAGPRSRALRREHR